VAAPPVEGAANQALARLLVATLDVRASAIRIVAGATGRRKVVEIDGLEPGPIRSRWPDLDV